MKPAPARGSRLVSAAVALAIAAPFLLFAVALPRMGELPRNDYWDDFLGVLEADGTLSRDPWRWLGARSNEHRIGALLPLWLANAAATGGDNRGLSALSLALLIATFAILYRRLPAAARGRPATRALWGVPLAAAVATPAAAHNWVLGFSGNQWFLANLLAVVALAALTAPGPWRPRRLAAVAAPLALAALTHSTYLALAAALGAAAVALELPRRIRSALVGLALAAGLLFLAGYERPAHHAPPERDPAAVAALTLEYLGGFFVEQRPAARAAGAVGVALLAVGALALRRAGGGPEHGLWPLLGVYGGAAALLTAVGRGAGEAVSPATVSRYASLQALFWIGVVAALAVASPASARRPRTAAAAALALAAALAANQRLGLERLAAHLDQVRWQPIAALGLRREVRDPEVLAHVTPFVSPASLRFFRALGHVPFDRPPEGAGLSPVATPPRAAPGRRAGSWADSRALRGRHARLSGALPAGAAEGDLVLLVDPAGEVRGAGAPIPSSASGLELLAGRRPPPVHWMGYVLRNELSRVRPLYLPTGADAPTRALPVAKGARRPAPPPP